MAMALTGDFLRMIRVPMAAALLLGAAAGVRAQAVPGAPQSHVAAVDLTWGVKIPMRDGVQLNATLYRPARHAGTVPVIFTLTPYIADSYHDRAMYFASHGYVFALVDCAGAATRRGASIRSQQEDRGRLRRRRVARSQPWCDGKVAMWGGSYAGFDQWMTAEGAPAPP